MREKIWFYRAPDDAQAAAAADGAADTAGANNGAAGSDGSAGGADSGWYAALDVDTRKTVEAKGWLNKSADEAAREAAKSYVHLFREHTTKTANAIPLPEKNAPPEKWEEVYAKLGRPEKPDGYEFKLPEGLPEDIPYDQKLSLNAKEWAHRAGLNPQQAQILHDEFAKYQAGQYAELSKAHVETLKKADEALESEWGPKDGPTFTRNVELAKRVLNKQGGDELKAELKSIGALDPNGNVKTPKLAMMLAKIGQEFYAEDHIHGHETSEPNPFAPGPNENMKRQGEILTRDPDLARALIRSAGLDPKEWQL